MWGFDHSSYLLPPIMLFLPRNQNQQLFLVFCLFWFPLWRVVFVWVKRRRRNIFSVARLWGIILTDSSLRQIFFLTDVIILTLSILCLLKVSFVPFRLFFSIGKVLLCLLTDWLLSRRTECHWMHRPAHIKPLWWILKSYSDSLYNRWARWITLGDL